MAETSSEFDYLRDKHRQLREQNSPELNLRTHRSISWLSRASALVDDDPDAAFIFSWIAFNAAYAKDMGEDPGSFARTDFQKFFDALVRCDPKGSGTPKQVPNPFQEGSAAQISPFFKACDNSGSPPFRLSQFSGEPLLRKPAKSSFAFIAHIMSP